MLRGQFSPSIFFKLLSYVNLGTLALIYYIAISLGHVEPIPKTDISGCAGHYPQFVFFRISTISGAVFMALGWLTNHFYIQTIAREKVFRIHAYHPQISLIFGLMGAIGLMGSTANIDTGIRNGTWHQHCAATFFLFTSLGMFYNTFICWVLYNKTRKVTFTSISTKLILTALMILQGWISSRSSNNLMEWTYAITIFIVFLSMANDVEDFKFVYTEEKAEFDR